MLKKLTAVLLAGAMLAAGGISASAREIDAAPEGARGSATVVAADYEPVGTMLTPPEDLPSAYNSADYGWVTPVRNQSYNTCWAYSSTASLESLLIRQGVYNAHLSTMHMNFWGTPEPESGKGWQRDYAAGGYPYIALGYLTSFGAITDELFPITSSMSDYELMNGSVYPYVGVDSVIYIDGSDRDTIKTAVYNYGAAIGNFHYDTTYSSAGNSAYYCDLKDIVTSRLLGHAVSIIGWDDNYSRYNFSAEHRPENNGAWFCKNSWGTGYGAQGYIWISYEDMHLFDSRFGPSYSIMSYTEKNPNTAVKQNEKYGAVVQFDYAEQMRERLSKITYANVFDFSDGYHYIDKILFATDAEGSSYEIFYIPLDENDVPVADESRWMLLAKGDVGFQGYISANAYGFYVPDSKGAVAVRIAKNGTSGSLDIGVDEWLSTSGRLLFEPDTRRGDSYIIGFDTEPMDLMDFYHNYLTGLDGVSPDEIGGTFVIKALCRSDDRAGDVDRDGSFTIMDVSASQRILAGVVEPDDVQRRYMDYDNDSDTSIADCTKMQRRLADDEV